VYSFVLHSAGSGGDPAEARRVRLSVIAFTVFTVGLAAVTFNEVRVLTRPFAPTPLEVVKDVVVRNAEDLVGRKASFRILLFSDEFRWRINSADALDTPSGRPQFTSEMKSVLDEAREIICIGASSEEIPSGVSYEVGRLTEERRAARRAEQIAIWVREALSKPIPVRKLNVGHHAPTRRPTDTSDQRRVVIVLVLDHDEKANIDQALRDAMAREVERAPVFDTLLTRYSLATGEAFSWVP
jgi:hypothetical protein